MFPGVVKKWEFRTTVAVFSGLIHDTRTDRGKL